MRYLLSFALATLISCLLTPYAIKLAKIWGAVDQPDGDRHIHAKPTARLGGVAIAAAFITTVLVMAPINRQLLALLVAAMVLVVVGVIDDRRGLSPWVKLIWQLVAAGIALAGGIGITAISKPVGGYIDITWGRFLVDLGPIRFHITPLANFLSIVWIVGLVNAINFLDGIDGLACGVSAIASFFLFALALAVHQPAVAVIAMACFGAAVGFLPYNFFPARIFLGDSGAYLLGLVLALVAIYSGGKLATAVLVLGFTIIDGLITVLRRLYRRSSPFKADRSHLHHLLLDFGLSQRQTVMLYYLLAIALGIVALLSGTVVKIAALGVLSLTTVLIAAILIRLSKQPVTKS